VYQVFPYTIFEVDTLHVAVTIVIATKQMEQRMKGQVLAVDFEKRELKDTQHKSDNDKQSFYINKTKSVMTQSPSFKQQKVVAFGTCVLT